MIRNHQKSPFDKGGGIVSGLHRYEGILSPTPPQKKTRPGSLGPTREDLPSLKLTVRTWNTGVGSDEFPFGARPTWFGANCHFGGCTFFFELDQVHNKKPSGRNCQIWWDLIWCLFFRCQVHHMVENAFWAACSPMSLEARQRMPMAYHRCQLHNPIKFSWQLAIVVQMGCAIISHLVE